MKKIYPVFLALLFVALHAHSQCSTATGFSHSNITPWSVKINYSAYAANDLIECGIGNFSPGTNNTPGTGGRITYIGSVNTTLDFLYGGLTYTYYIRKYCGNNIWSANSTAGTFTTAPCFAMNFQGFGAPHVMNFSGRGYIDSYSTSCSGTYGTYYGKENMLQYLASIYSAIIYVEYNNPTNHAVTYSFRANPEGLNYCNPSDVNCKDKLTVSPGTTYRYYSIDIANPSIFYTMLMFDIDDSATYSSNGPSVTVYVNVGCGNPGTINATSSTICQGTPVTMTPTGGTVPPGSIYNWYAGNCGQTWYGTGNSLTVTPNVTTTYYARLEGPCGYSGCISKTITVNNNPFAFISSTTCAPGVINQLIANNAVPPYTFQWRKDGASIIGATNANYIPGATGNYDCLVSNLCATNTSNVITVNVFSSAPVVNITSPYSPPLYCPGGTVPLNATAVAGQSYQWKLNGTSIPGATTTSYNANVAGQYTCVATNPCGSTSASIFVDPAPVGVATPHSAVNFCTGGSVWITVNISTTHPQYWSRDGIQISGATSNNYTATQSGVYTWTYVLDCGLVTTSNSVTVTVSNTPTANITTNGSTTFCSPGSVVLNANTGTGFIYQWRRNGANLSGATSAYYYASASGSYDCIVNSSCGSATSNAIVVTVNVAPSAAGAITGQATSVCSSTKTYSVAAIANATSYVWTTPAGSNITSGQGTTSVNITFTAAFSSGNISVTGTNSCGSGTAASINVIAAPAQPGTITGPVSVCHNQNNVIYSVAVVTGATSYTWTVPPGTNIKTGQGTRQIKVRFGNSAGSVTVKANNSCGSGAIRSVVIAMPCRDEEEITDELFNVRVYPNPSMHAFTFEVNSSSDDQVTITIFDLTGRQLETHKVTEKNFQCGENLPAGIYLAEIISGENRKLIKLIKEAE